MGKSASRTRGFERIASSNRNEVDLGLQSVLFKSGSSSQDSLIAELWEQGTTGIIEEAGGMRAFFNENADLSDLFDQHRNSIIEVRTEQPVDWQQVSREGWDPILVGQRFFVAPPWVDEPIPRGANEAGF